MKKIMDDREKIDKEMKELQAEQEADGKKDKEFMEQMDYLKPIDDVINSTTEKIAAIIEDEKADKDKQVKANFKQLQSKIDKEIESEQLLIEDDEEEKQVAEQNKEIEKENAKALESKITDNEVKEIKI